MCTILNVINFVFPFIFSLCVYFVSYYKYLTNVLILNWLKIKFWTLYKQVRFTKIKITFFGHVKNNQLFLHKKVIYKTTLKKLLIVILVFRNNLQWVFSLRLIDIISPGLTKRKFSNKKVIRCINIYIMFRL